MPEFRSNPPSRFAHTLGFALFVTSALWVIASHSVAGSAARGLTVRFNLPDGEALLSSILFLFLLAVGFGFLQIISHRPRQLREVLGLPKRSTAREEWLVGAALGWGTVVLAVLPMALFATLRVHFFPDLRSFSLIIVNLATLLVAGLAEEVAFRGYPFRRLIDALGPVTATLISAVLFGLAHASNPDSTWISILITMLAGILFSLAWLRTHGLWLPWGLHFAWNASMGILFGLPVSGLNDFSTVIRTHAMGRDSLTGGSYGPEAAFFTIFAILITIVALLLLTREYAWNYTHPPVIPGGYPLDVAPPPAHTAMEAAAQAQSAPLIQILSTTPGSMSVQPPPIKPSSENGSMT